MNMAVGHGNRLGWGRWQAGEGGAGEEDRWVEGRVRGQ